MSTPVPPPPPPPSPPDVPVAQAADAVRLSPRKLWWRRRTLRERTVLLITVLVCLGFAIFATAAMAMLGNVLREQIDRQLNSTANVIATSSVNDLIQNVQTSPLPSDYYVRLDQSGRPPLEWYSPSSFDVAELPSLSREQLTGMTPREPFTVSAADGSREWRVVMGHARNANGAFIGHVAVALPLDSVSHAVQRLRVAFVLIGGGLAVLAIIVGLAAARRALRPLSFLEDTAAGIVSGDLTRRVPESHPRTEVGQLTMSFNGMLDHIEASIHERDRANDRLRQFVSDASHELRTPLAAIRGYSELYRMGAVPDDQVPRTLSQIEESSIRMGDLVNDLLTLARLDEGQMAQVQPVDVGPVLDRAVDDAQASSAEHVVTVEGTSAPDLTVLADASWLHQVVANLLGNALTHTPAGTRVGVRADAGSETAVIRVSDTGPGIPPEHLDRIFERFYRVDEARTREGSNAGGSGLGLAIVDRLVRAMGGSVRIESVLDEGTTVIIELPLVTTAEE